MCSEAVIIAVLCRQVFVEQLPVRMGHDCLHGLGSIIFCWSAVVFFFHSFSVVFLCKWTKLDDSF